MAADPGKEEPGQKKGERTAGALQALRKTKVELHQHENIPQSRPNDPVAELFESGGSSSSGTWMASDACEAFSSGSADSGSNETDGGSSGRLDCDPGSLRLRTLLQAAQRERSASLASSCCDGQSESGEIASEEVEVEMEMAGPPRFVTRAASARRFMEKRARPSSGDSAAASELSSGSFGSGDDADAAVAAGQDADAELEGAAALAAALEAVLLCPPRVLARSTSSQGQGSFLSSLLTPTSAPSDMGCVVEGPAPGWDGAGDGNDDNAAEDAVKAALAWSFPVPKLSRVEEEPGAAVDEGETASAPGEGKDRRTVSENWDIVTSSAPGSRSNAMPESVEASATAVEGGRASDSAVVLACHREAFAVVGGDHGDHGVRGRGNGVEGRGLPPPAVSSGGNGGGNGGGSGGGGGGSGGQAWRRVSLKSNSSGEPDSDTLPPSPLVSGTHNARRPSFHAHAADGSDSRSCDGSASLTVTPPGGGGAGAEGGFTPSEDTGLERSSTKHGAANSKSAADDDESGSVEDCGGGDCSSKAVRRSSFGSAGGSGPPTNRRSNQRPRWGSMNMSEFSVEDASPSATALALEREKLLLNVFGRQGGAAELATVGRSNSCHVFLEAASRIADLPPHERSLLAELDRSSDDEGGDGDGDGDGDHGSYGDSVDDGDVASRPPTEERAPSPEGAATGKASPASRKLPLLRVGCAESGRDADTDAPTTAYRYRRLAGHSGRGWPPRVDPARREEWLCPIEFEAVFGMAFAEFRGLPAWKRTILKQEVHLF